MGQNGAKERVGVVIDIDGVVVRRDSGFLGQVEFIPSTLALLRQLYQSRQVTPIIWTTAEREWLDEVLDRLSKVDLTLWAWLVHATKLTKGSKPEQVSAGFLQKIGLTEEEYRRLCLEWEQAKVKNPWLVEAIAILENDERVHDLARELGIPWLDPEIATEDERQNWLKAVLPELR